MQYIINLDKFSFGRRASQRGMVYGVYTGGMLKYWLYIQAKLDWIC